MSHPRSITGDGFALRGVTVRYTKEFTVKLPDTEFTEPCTLLHGESGCGKSTALMVLAGHLPHTTGEVMRPAGRIAYVTQELNLLKEASVLQNILIAQTLAGKRPDKVRARELLTRLGVGDDRIINAKPAAISVGQKQRAAIARALAIDATYLLLDEPSSGLHRDNVPALIAAIGELVPLTRVIIATHDDRLTALPHFLVTYPKSHEV
jgi:ABC-type lipoprotein export system ATPase subunit